MRPNLGYSNIYWTNKDKRDADRKRKEKDLISEKDMLPAENSDNSETVNGDIVNISEEIESEIDKVERKKLYIVKVPEEKKDNEVRIAR